MCVFVILLLTVHLFLIMFKVRLVVFDVVASNNQLINVFCWSGKWLKNHKWSELWFSWAVRAGDDPFNVDPSCINKSTHWSTCRTLLKCWNLFSWKDCIESVCITLSRSHIRWRHVSQQDFGYIFCENVVRKVSKPHAINATMTNTCVFSQHTIRSENIQTLNCLTSNQALRATVFPLHCATCFSMQALDRCVWAVRSRVSCTPLLFFTFDLRLTCLWFLKRTSQYRFIINRDQILQDTTCNSTCKFQSDEININIT